MRRVARLLAVTLAMGLGLPLTAQRRTLVAFAGSYSTDTTYSLNDMVSQGGDFYISVAANNRGNAPESAAEWARVGSSRTTGTTGATGATGAPGATGATGQDGPPGARGVAGAAGLVGAAGGTGMAGTTGAAGVTGPQGATGAIGPAGAMGLTGLRGATGVAGSSAVGTVAGESRETRTFSVAAYKGYNIMGGSSMTLFSATGAGNVERIQLAAGYNSGDPSTAPIAANTVLTIVVDGRTYRCTLGMFLLWNGYATGDGVAATSDLFVTKYLGITSGTSLSNETLSGYRRIYIKYNSSISISIAVPQGPNIVWWSQVEYYPGVAPAGRYPATRNVFHMVANDWAAIAPGQTVSVLQAVTGAGELESIYFVSSAPGKVEPQWLEQNPIIAVDGTDFHYGGTEDFFGNQFYGDQFHGRTDEYGIARAYSSGAPDSTTYWSGYRYFRESPMLFNSSVGMVWQNVSAEMGPAARVGTLAVYYTTE
jgi:hypothetical protein